MYTRPEWRFINMTYKANIGGPSGPKKGIYLCHYFSFPRKSFGNRLKTVIVIRGELQETVKN